MMQILHVFFLLCLGATVIQAASNDSNERKSYIVYMGEISSEIDQITREDHHHRMLIDAIGDENIARASKIHSYGKSFNGFAAKLLPHEAARISENSGVVSVFPNTMRKLLTTRSWDFLGMPLNLKLRNHRIESDIIVGLLDTGIYVDAPSFDDKGYGPSPSRWKAKCDKGENFTGCYRKVIGAKFFNLEDFPQMSPTPTDTDGHGTHTASTAAGNSVKGASLYGVAEGTARGGVPSARIASYKVCGYFGCSDMDILAGFDDAIADGVDILSVSLGGQASNFVDNSVAIGSFHAMRKGILTVCAAGNDGPFEGSVDNVTPWMLTVGATNMDRQFRTNVKLGNGMKIDGMSINTFSPEKTIYPLTSSVRVYNASDNNIPANASTCVEDTLIESKVKGKIVLCLNDSTAGSYIKTIQGAGTIIALAELKDWAANTLLPASMISAKQGRIIEHYIRTTKSPQASIYKTTTINNMKAPVVASFSSRGPQKLVRNILKPDISAPGIDILAGYSKLVTITDSDQDNRVDTFNIMSGTSMACPHVSGAGAYVKTFHPYWSPAAIKSALMTTAKPVDGTGTENPLDTGSGLLNPVAALNPGLVYDMTANDYVRYLCKEGYNSSTIAILLGDKSPHFSCSEFKQSKGLDGINYPSMHYQLLIDETKIEGSFYRTVTHVADGPAIYKANVIAPKGLSIKVVPNVLSFTKANQKRSFKVMVKGAITEGIPNILTAFVEWNDSKHRVRSPLVIYKTII